MSSGDKQTVEVAMEVLTQIIERWVAQTWAESQRWPEHPNASVTVTWVLNPNGSVSPELTVKPQPGLDMPSSTPSTVSSRFELTPETVEQLLSEAFHIGWRQSREWPGWYKPAGLEVTWREGQWPRVEPKAPKP